jgi:glycine C-acetyltransferase
VKKLSEVILKGGIILAKKVLADFLTPQLNELRENGLYNVIDTVEGPNGPTVTINGKSLINMSSNNYLGLANNERMKQKAHEAIEAYGLYIDNP